MRIMLVSGIYAPDIGGPATFIPKLAFKLQSLKNEIFTVSLTDKSASRDDEEWDRIFVRRDLPKYLRFPITIITLVFHGLKADVIFSNGLYEECAIANLFLRKPLIVKIVGDPIWERATNRKLTNVSIEDFNKKEVKGFLGLERKLLGWSLSRAKLVITPSRQLETLVKLWSSEVCTQVIPNSIKIQNKMHQVKNKKFDVVFVGRLTKWKKVDNLISACAKIQCSLAIVGTGPELEQLKAFASKLQYDIEFLGERNKSDVVEILLQSRIFCLPSSYEGMSHALLEAMSESIPVVVSDILPNKEIIQHEINGLIFRLGDVTDLSEKIKQLIGSPELRKKLAIQAKFDVMTKYEEEKILTKFANFIVSK